jgi:hypothetical protein
VRSPRYRFRSVQGTESLRLSIFLGSAEAQGLLVQVLQVIGQFPDHPLAAITHHSHEVRPSTEQLNPIRHCPPR